MTDAIGGVHERAISRLRTICIYHWALARIFVRSSFPAPGFHLAYRFTSSKQSEEQIQSIPEQGIQSLDVPDPVVSSQVGVMPVVLIQSPTMALDGRNPHKRHTTMDSGPIIERRCQCG